LAPPPRNRLSRLELIRERAALGKDFERRDSFSSAAWPQHQSPTSSALSGASLGAAAAVTAGGGGITKGAFSPSVPAVAVAAVAPLPPLSPLVRSNSSSIKEASAQPAAGIPTPQPTDSSTADPPPTATTKTTTASVLSASAPPFTSALSAASQRPASPAPSIYTQAARRSSPTLTPASVYNPSDAALQRLLSAGTQSVAPRSVTPAGTARNKVRGARKRTAKMARRLQAAG